MQALHFVGENSQDKNSMDSVQGSNFTAPISNVIGERKHEWAFTAEGLMSITGSPSRMVNDKTLSHHVLEHPVHFPVRLRLALHILLKVY